MKRKAVRRRTVTEAREDRDLAAIAGAALDEIINRWGPGWSVEWSTPARGRDRRTGELKAFALELYVQRMVRRVRKEKHG